MSSEKQEYFHSGEYVTVFSQLSGDDNFVVVETSGGDLNVVRKNQLVKKEDSYYFKRAEERRAEIENITKKAQDNLDKLSSKLVDKALLDLASRLKFNVLFGKDVDGATAGWAVTISDELKKLVKEKAPDVLKKEDPFA